MPATASKSLTIVDFLMKMISANMVGAVAQGDLLPVLVMSVLFGFALVRWMGELDGDRLRLVLDGDPDADIEPLGEPVLADGGQG